MTIPWETIHIFISSTFNDMHAERDYLVKQVFPELREWCEKRKLRLVDIDLRWGVTEQDATSQNVVKVCLDRIDDCRPFFLCFLGQRRGWVPKEGEISSATKAEFPALGEYAGKASVTELEILHALVNPLHHGRERDPKKPSEFYEPSKYAFFYLRKDTYIDQLPTEPPQLRETYTNEGVEDKDERKLQDNQLEEWRELNIPATHRPVRYYQAHWNPNLTTPELLLPLKCPSAEEKTIQKWQDTWLKAGVTVSGVDVEADPSQAEKAHGFNKLISTGRLTDFQADSQPLNQVIVADLQATIAARFPDHTEVVGETDLQKELDQQEQFLYSGSQGFIERRGDFDDLDAYITGGSNQLFVLTAPGGMGKSSLLATWVDRYRITIEGMAGCSIHFRFIGQSDRSTSVYSLLHLLLQELKEAKDEFPEEIPDDPQKLRQELSKLLESAGKGGKTVIVLDALNQLETGLSDLTWLPYRLPPNIKLIVSFKRGEPEAENLLYYLQEKAILGEVKPFENLEHRKQLVDKYLEQYLKQLDPTLVDALIRSPGASNPLYLKVVLSELRVFGAFANLGEKIHSDFGETPISAFDAVLRRLENDPAYSSLDPKETVPLIFGLLAHARQGLSVDELVSLLIQALELKEEELSRQAAEDTIHLYLRQVRPFLARRDGRYDFFFENFKIATRQRYISERGHRKTSEEWHCLLAKYFSRLLTWENEIERIPTIRKATELTYQQFMGKMWLELFASLTDFQFLESRSRAASVYALESDYRLALSIWEEESEQKRVLSAFDECLRLNSHIIHRFPEQLFPIFYNTLTWMDTPDGSIHALCENARRSQYNWLRMVQDPRPEPPLWLQSLEGHIGSVDALAVTSDGQQVISGSRDNTLKVWNLSSGNLLRSLVGHTKPVKSVAVTRDAKWVISGSSDNTIKVWELLSGRLLRSLESHMGSVNSIGLTTDGLKAVSGSDDHTIKIWDLVSGQLLRSVDGHTDKVNALILTPDDQKIISGSDDKTVKVWDMISGQLLHTLKGHKSPVNALVVTQDGRQIASGSPGREIYVWNLSDGRQIRKIFGPLFNMTSLALTPDEKQLLSIDDNLIFFYDYASGKVLNNLFGHYNTMVLTQDGKQIITGSDDKTIKVWDFSSKKMIRMMSGHTNKITDVAVTSDGHQAVSGSFDKTLMVWDLAQGGVIHNLTGHKNWIYAVAITPDGKQAISGSADKTIKVWALTNGQLLHTLEGHTASIRAVAVTQDGMQVISGSEDGTIKIWDLASGRLNRSIEGHTPAVWSVKLTYDGKQIISIALDNAIRVWDLASGKLQHTLDIPKGSGLNFVLTPDEKQIITSGSADHTLKVIDLESGRLIRSLEGHSGPVSSLAITQDGKQVISGSNDRTLIVWDMASGMPLHYLIGHIQRVSAVTLTFDGQKVVSGSDDNTVKVWDITNGRQLCSQQGHSGAVHALVLTSDERHVISGSDDQTIKVWEVENGSLLHSLEAYNEPIHAMALTRDGKHLASGTNKSIQVWDLLSGRRQEIFKQNEEVHALALALDGRRVVSGTDNAIKVWDLDNKRLIRTIEGHPGAVRGVKLTPDGKQVISFSYANSVNVWDLENGRLLKTIEGHSKSINVVAVSPDGHQIITGSDDTTIKVWDLESGQLLRTLESQRRLLHSFEGHSGGVISIALTSNGQQVVSGSNDKTIKVWNLKNGNLIHTLEGHIFPIKAVVITPDGGKIISVSEHTFIVWDLTNGKLIQTIELHIFDNLAISSDGEQAVTEFNKTLTVWDLIHKSELYTLKGHTGRINAVLMTPDGKQAISGSADNTIKVWDLVNGQLLYTLVEGHFLPVRSLTLTPDGKQAISGSDDKTIKVWDMKSGQMLRTLEGHASDVNALVQTPDGRQVISGSSDKTIKVWDMENWRLLSTLEGHALNVNTLLYPPNKHQDISGSSDNLIKVWDLENNQLHYTLLEGHLLPVRSLTLTSDGKQVVSGSDDKTIKVWDITNRQLLQTLKGHTGSVFSIALTPDNRWSISGSGDKTLKLWDLESGQSKTLFVNDTDILSLLVSSDERWLACGDGFGRVWIFEWIHDEPKNRLAIPKKVDVLKPDLPTLEKLASQAYAAHEYEKSMKYFDLVLAQMPDDFNLLSNRVATLIKLNHYQEALERIEQILASKLVMGVNLGLIYMGKGNALQGLRRYDEATDWYSKATELAGSHSLIWYMQGRNFYISNKYEQALVSFRKARSLADEANTRIHIGLCLNCLKRFEEAENEYKNLIAECPADVTVFFHLAVAQKALGKITSALFNLDYFIENATGEHQSMMPEAKQMLEELSK